MKKARFIALYLPQYHPVKENDENWGKGFTEWTNTAKATPLFRGHYQPHIPADLGFYDLRLEDTRIAQAELAKEYGIEGFCYWYYWFGNGDKILERPLNEVIKSGKPDFPFCVAWANHSWTTSTWEKVNNEKKSVIIKEQKYLGAEDYTKFFYELLPAFKDKRYITVDGKPFFMIHNPEAIPDIDVFIKVWRELALANGLKGIYMIGSTTGISYKNSKNGHKLPNLNDTEKLYDALIDKGFDAVNSRGLNRALVQVQGRLLNFLLTAINTRLRIKILHKYKQAKVNDKILSEYDTRDNVFPSLYCSYDRSPRAGKAATILTESTPAVFKKLLKRAVKLMANKPEQQRIAILTSWNEWGEGNHLEPDLKYGRGYLEAIRDSLK
ncbi:MAG: glycoside hydrolase family 99-like domain-containing protein [Prevotellaceae bacterium]|nr:glycoside hydrolase family 99-like domain-containing protein [Candidatus Faecinaster equi]